MCYFFYFFTTQHMTQQIRVSPFGDNWRRVKNPLNSKASAVCDTKAEAVAIATEIAQNQWLELFVQNLNGQIGYKNSFGNDPRTIPG